MMLRWFYSSTKTSHDYQHEIIIFVSSRVPQLKQTKRKCRISSHGSKNKPKIQAHKIFHANLLNRVKKDILWKVWFVFFVFFYFVLFSFKTKFFDFGRETWHQANVVINEFFWKDHRMVTCDGAFNDNTRYRREGCRAKSQLKMISFPLLHVYSYLGKNHPYITPF